MWTNTPHADAQAAVACLRARAAAGHAGYVEFREPPASAELQRQADNEIREAFAVPPIPTQPWFCVWRNEASLEPYEALAGGWFIAKLHSGAVKVMDAQVADPNEIAEVLSETFK